MLFGQTLLLTMAVVIISYSSECKCLHSHMIQTRYNYLFKVRWFNHMSTDVRRDWGISSITEMSKCGCVWVFREACVFKKLLYQHDTYPVCRQWLTLVYVCMCMIIMHLICLHVYHVVLAARSMTGCYCTLMLKMQQV